MKHTVLILVLVAVVAAASAQTKASIKNLRTRYPHVKWNDKTAKTADVNCDGKPETIILGKENDVVVIGVARPEGQTQTFAFPVSAATQNGFCAEPTRIAVSPLLCETDEGTLDGCKAIKGCHAFSVIDGEWDSFNFYWDSSKKSLAWWRH